MLKACKTFIEANKGQKIIAHWESNNKVEDREVDGEYLPAQLKKWKKKELAFSSDKKLVFKYWDFETLTYERADKKINVHFSRDFYEDENGIMLANNCYNNDYFVAETTLSSVGFLLNYLYNECTDEVKDLLSKLDKDDPRVSFDGECLDITVEGKTYPIMLITEEK